MAHPTLYPRNFFEDAVITMEPDTPDTDAEEVEALVDRDIGGEVRDVDVTGDRTRSFDLGIDAGDLPMADAWAFAGSKYAGEVVYLEASDDALMWELIASITPVADVPQLVTTLDMSAFMAMPRYWRVRVTDPAEPVIFTEISLSIAVRLTRRPVGNALREPRIANVSTVQSYSGRAWGSQRGPSKWSAEYVMEYVPDADRTLTESFLETLLDGALPCWHLTIQGNLEWVRVNGNVAFSAADRAIESNAKWNIPISVVRELP